MAERRATKALTAARKAFEVAKTKNGSSQEPKPVCISCEKSVAQPCWACVECQGEIYGFDHSHI